MKYQDIHYEQQMKIFSEYEDVQQLTQTNTNEQLRQMKDQMEQNCSIILEQRCFSDITILLPIYIDVRLLAFICWRCI